MQEAITDATDAQNTNETAVITGSPRQVAEMAAMAFNAGKSVTLVTSEGASELHEEFKNTRESEDMTVEVSDHGVPRLSFSAFFVQVTDGATAHISD